METWQTVLDVLDFAVKFGPAAATTAWLMWWFLNKLVTWFITSCRMLLRAVRALRSPTCAIHEWSEQEMGL